MDASKLNELKNYIKENSYLIYEYINKEVLKDIGVLNPNYFIKIIQEVFVDKEEIEIEEQNATTNLIPYFIFTLFSQDGKIAYTSLRNESINFEQLDKEAKVYYNYARFSIKNEFLSIELMQSKIGGMPISGDIVKFTKNIQIQGSNLELFIEKNKNSLFHKDEYIKIKEEVNNLLT